MDLPIPVIPLWHGGAMDRDHLCDHRARAVGSVAVVACGACGDVEWFVEGRPADPAEGLAALFGDFDLAARVPTVAGPAATALAYTPGRRSPRRWADAFTPGRWWRVDETLWLCHDGSVLLLCPTDPLLAANLTRGA